MTTENTNALVRLAREARRSGDRARAVELLGRAHDAVGDAVLLDAVTETAEGPADPLLVVAHRAQREARS